MEAKHVETNTTILVLDSAAEIARPITRAFKRFEMEGWEWGSMFLPNVWNLCDIPIIDLSA